MKSKLLILTLLSGVFCAASAHAIIVDGRFDANEGYTNTTSLYYKTDSGTSIATPGTMYSYVDPITKDVYAAFVVPLSLVDNTYGTNAIGWNKGHTFRQLILSDAGRFAAYGSNGQVVMDFYLDYLTGTGPPGKSPQPGETFSSLGVTGGDGRMLTGRAAHILEWGTSLEYNLNELGYNLTKNSPKTTTATNPDGSINYNQPYNDSVTHPGWIYEMVYEVKISGAAFAQSGFSQIAFTEIHASPNKIGAGSIVLIPEPSTWAAVFGLCLLIGVKERSKIRSLFCR